MNSLAAKYLQDPKKKGSSRQVCDGDVFVANVINQKAVNQSAQQVLVLVAAQVLNITEAQFGFATNENNDLIDA